MVVYKKMIKKIKKIKYCVDTVFNRWYYIRAENKTNVSMLYQHLCYYLSIAYELITVTETHVATEQPVLAYSQLSCLLLRCVRRALTDRLLSLFFLPPGETFLLNPPDFFIFFRSLC